MDLHLFGERKSVKSVLPTCLGVLGKGEYACEKIYKGTEQRGRESVARGPGVVDLPQPRSLLVCLPAAYIRVCERETGRRRDILTYFLTLISSSCASSSFPVSLLRRRLHAKRRNKKN